MADRAVPTRSDRHPFSAINPADGKPFDVFITDRRAARAAKRGKGAVLEMAYTVEEVLQSPQAIFEGLRCDEDEDKDDPEAIGWLCYCGRPSQYYDPNDTTPRPSIGGYVFLVFVNSERTVYHWYWDLVDGDGSGCPRGHGKRFRKKALG